MPDDLLRIPPKAQALMTNSERIAAAADEAARRYAFEDYRSRLAANTVRRHDADLRCFEQFLADVGITIPETEESEPPALATQARLWQPITFGLVTAFRQWMLQECYTIGSVNVRLGTVRTYAKLAHQAGVMPSEQYLLIKNVASFSPQEGRRIDTKRREQAEKAKIKHSVTRRGAKKAMANILSPEQIDTLINNHPRTRLGLRDTLIICFLAEYGLRCGELANMRREHLLSDGTFYVHRDKTNTVQRMQLFGNTQTVLNEYLHIFTPESEHLILAAIDKHDNVRSWGISDWSVRDRVRKAGKLYLGIRNLSPHDLRHSWATQLAQEGIPLPALRDAGGWRTLTTPGRYIAEQEIANQAVLQFRKERAKHSAQD